MILSLGVNAGVQEAGRVGAKEPPGFPGEDGLRGPIGPMARSSVTGLKPPVASLKEQIGAVCWESLRKIRSIVSALVDLIA